MNGKWKREDGKWEDSTGCLCRSFDELGIKSETSVKGTWEDGKGKTGSVRIESLHRSLLASG